MAERGREAKRLGATLKDEPQSFPGEVLVLVRRSFRTVWRARGGGLYACGFVLTFVFLEVRMLFVDIFQAESVGSFFTEQLAEMFFRYLGESIQNTIAAFIWPVWFMQLQQPWGIGILAAMYFAFATFIKEPLEQWLFDDRPEGLNEDRQVKKRP